jgi:hypothetical protein
MEHVTNAVRRAYAELTTNARLAREEGQGAVEYVGIIIVVVAIIAIIAGNADQVGEAISSGLQEVVGRLTNSG